MKDSGLTHPGRDSLYLSLPCLVLALNRTKNLPDQIKSITYSNHVRNLNGVNRVSVGLVKGDADDARWVLQHIRFPSIANVIPKDKSVSIRIEWAILLVTIYPRINKSTCMLGPTMLCGEYAPCFCQR
jgi:hypothetical protein